MPKKLPKVKDKYGKKVISAIDALNGVEVGMNTIILGGGLVACETALHLKSLKKDVKIIIRKGDIVNNLNWVNRTNLIELMQLSKIEIINNTEIIEVGNTLKLLSNGKVNILRYDTLIVAIGALPNSEIYDKLSQEVLEIHKIGDCNKPGRLLNAIWDGYNKARLI